VDVDRLVPGWRLSDGELTAALSTSQAELDRMYARMLELVGEADSRGLAAGKGFRDTKAFLVRALRISPREADARIAAATADLPVTKAALAAGEISSEHVHEIAKVLTQAPDSLAPGQLADDETILVELARHASPPTVQKAGRRLLAFWDLEDTDPDDRDRDLARPWREFRYSFTRDGRMRFSGEFDPEIGTLAEHLLIPLAKPDPVDAQGNPDPWTTAERHGDAFAAIVDLAARAPDLPVKAGERAVVTVTIGIDELERRAAMVLLDGWGAMTVEQLRRICCDAQVLPAVLGRESEVLDLGRAARTATPGQRRALAIRDRGCTAPGCGRGPKWTTPHHITFWSDLGPSDLIELLVVAALEDRGVSAEVPLVEWPDVVVLVGDEAVHRHHAVHDYRAHRFSSNLLRVRFPILSSRGGSGL
jgi:hypothetical protein